MSSHASTSREAIIAEATARFHERMSYGMNWVSALRVALDYCQEAARDAGFQEGVDYVRGGPHA